MRKPEKEGTDWKRRRRTGRKPTKGGRERAEEGRRRNQTKRKEKRKGKKWGICREGETWSSTVGPRGNS